MSAQAIIAALSAIVALFVTITTWGFLSGRFAGGAERQMRALAESLANHVKESDRRFNDANEHTSKAMSYVQGMETKFLRDFAGRELTDERFAESRRDREHLRHDITTFKSDYEQFKRDVQHARRHGDDHN